jgi:hypothetical protein
MTDYIKRIQRRLKLKGISKKRSELIEQIKVFGYEPDTLSDELTDLITSQLLDKFIISSEKTDNNLLNSSPDHTPSDSNHPDEKTKDFTGINKNQNKSPLSLTESDEINSAEIIVSQEDKSEVILAQASVYGIELSEVEVLELASNVGDKFTDYMEFVRETKQAIKSYADHRYDSLERQISDTSEDLKTHFEHRERQLNQKLATGLGEINTFFRTQSTKRKELSKVIAAAFKT